MKKEGFDFFQNRACEYFPCHKRVADEDFNCLFCYCPLYLLGDECGGNFEYLPNGIKNCSKLHASSLQRRIRTCDEQISAHCRTDPQKDKMYGGLTHFRFVCETTMKSLVFSIGEHRFFFLCI